MKTCIVEGCNNNVFTHEDCKIHSYLYYNSKSEIPVIKRSVIPPQSLKRIEDNKQYRIIKAQRKIQLIQEGRYRCIFCDKEFGKIEPGWHHLAGRDGDLFLNPKYLFPAHDDCHVIKYHSGTWESLNKEKWFMAFLWRLKGIDETLYNKEINKSLK